jgi:AraC-like DNA-binding protein/quercetin dioxygenase-like cupin family protein
MKPMEPDVAQATRKPRARQIPGARGFECLVGTFRGHEFPRHSHEGLMLSVVLGGTQRVECRQGALVAGPGQIIAVSPEEPHRSVAGAEGWWRYHSLMAPPAAAAELGGYRVALRVHEVIRDPHLAAAIQAMTTPMLAGEALMAQHVLGRVLHLFLARHGRLLPTPVAPPGRETRAVATARAYLRDTLDRNVVLADLVRVTGIDGHRLTRAFTRVVGMPPHAWHLQARLREGQDRLSRGESIADTAAGTGFADQAHFTRFFRRLCGVTPASYRAAHSQS